MERCIGQHASRRARTLLCLGVGVFVTILCAISFVAVAASAWYISVGGGASLASDRSFDAKAWRLPSSRDPANGAIFSASPRQRMLNDLLGREILARKTCEEIRELLGDPDGSEVHNGTLIWSYRLGAATFDDTQYLDISFKSDGVVREIN